MFLLRQKGKFSNEGTDPVSGYSKLNKIVLLDNNQSLCMGTCLGIFPSRISAMLPIANLNHVGLTGLDLNAP